MDRVIKGKWLLRLAVVGVFVLGGVAGALLTNLYYVRLAHGSRGWMRDGAGSFVGLRNLTERLDLTEDQSTQVRTILDQARKELFELRQESDPRVQEIRSRTDQKLKEVLTDSQWEKFKQLKSEFRERHRGRRGHWDGDR
jgi:Spy/CpxP family protein refolding chaperone